MIVIPSPRFPSCCFVLFLFFVVVFFLVFCFFVVVLFLFVFFGGGGFVTCLELLRKGAVKKLKKPVLLFGLYTYAL